MLGLSIRRDNCLVPVGEAGSRCEIGVTND